MFQVFVHLKFHEEQHSWNLSIAQNVLYSGKRFFVLLKCFSQYEKRNCSMKGSLWNPSLQKTFRAFIFNSIETKDPI